MTKTIDTNNTGLPPLWEKLPAWVRDEDDGTTQRLLTAFAECAATWQQRIHQTSLLYDPAHTPEWAADLILRSWGFHPPAALGQKHKRRLVRWAAALWQRAGTAIGIEQAVRAVTGREARCLPWNHGLTLDTGHVLDGEIGLAASLHRPQDAHAFDLALQGNPNADQQSAIRELVDMLRPAHCPLRRLIYQQTPSQKMARQFAARCALGLFRQPQRNHRINAALQEAARVFDLPGIAPRQNKQFTIPPLQSTLPDGAVFDPGQGLAVDKENRPLSLDKQAAALMAWSQGNTRELGEALIARPMINTPISNLPLDTRNSQAYNVLNLADFVIALCNFF